MRQSTEKDCADNEWARNWGHSELHSFPLVCLTAPDVRSALHTVYDYNQVAPWARKYAAESIVRVTILPLSEFPFTSHAFIRTTDGNS